MKQRTILYIAVLIGVTFNLSCNVWSILPTEELKHNEDKYSVAITKGNDGDCQGTIDILSKVTDPTDPTLIALGWAYLCAAGATPNSLAITLFQYRGSSPNYAVIGQLAINLLPVTPEKLMSIDIALNYFSQVSDQNLAAFPTMIGKIVSAAALLGAQATNQGSSLNIEKIDIDTSCSNDCTSCTNPGMTDSAVTELTSDLTDAYYFSDFTNAAEFKHFLASLTLGLSGGSASARCFIYKSLIPSS